MAIYLGTLAGRLRSPRINWGKMLATLQGMSEWALVLRCKVSLISPDSFVAAYYTIRSRGRS